MPTLALQTANHASLRLRELLMNGVYLNATILEPLDVYLPGVNVTNLLNNANIDFQTK